MLREPRLGRALALVREQVDPARSARNPKAQAAWLAVNPPPRRRGSSSLNFWKPGRDRQSWRPRPVFACSSSIRFDASALLRARSKSSWASSESVFRYDDWVTGDEPMTGAQ